MKRFYCYISMLDQPLIVSFYFWNYFNCMIISTAPLLFYMCIYSQSLSPTAGVGPFIASVLEFWFLSLVHSTWVIPTIG
jgi:hypothetical protein